jgi:hypothetical protein
VNPYLILQARIEARALLFAAGEYDDLAEAIDPLLAYADASGISENIGPDNVVAMVVRGFGIDVG